MELLLDGRLIHCRETLHTELKNGLGFPEYYGHNLDALSDCLEEISEDTVIELVNVAALEEKLGSYTGKLIRVLKRAEKENPHIRFYCGMRRLDLENYPRKEAYAHFSTLNNSFYSLTFRQDVTNLRRFAKEQGISAYYALVYCIGRAVNSVEAFRCAMFRGEPVVLDERIPCFTDLHPGAEQFHAVTLPLQGIVTEFACAAKEKSEQQKHFTDKWEEGKGYINLSCLPWLTLSAVTGERSIDPEDTTPQFHWGKYEEEDGKTFLHISIDANHRFVDGLHIGLFHQELTRMIETLP